MKASELAQALVRGRLNYIVKFATEKSIYEIDKFVEDPTTKTVYIVLKEEEK